MQLWKMTDNENLNNLLTLGIIKASLCFCTEVKFHKRLDKWMMYGSDYYVNCYPLTGCAR